MKNILVISTGGTISQTRDENNVAISDENAYKGNTFADVLDRMKEKVGVNKIDSKTILNKDSSTMISKDWETIVDAILEDYDNYDAFVVTQLVFTGNS